MSDCDVLCFTSRTSSPSAELLSHMQVMPQYFITRFCVRFRNEPNDTNIMRNSRHANRQPPVPHLQRYSLPLCCGKNQIYLLTPQLTPAQTLNGGKNPTTAYTTRQIPRWHWHERITISPDPISGQSISCLWLLSVAAASTLAIAIGLVSICVTSSLRSHEVHRLIRNLLFTLILYSSLLVFVEGF
jgi:hypothetical protein